MPQFIPFSFRTLSETLGQPPGPEEGMRIFCSPSRIAVARREAEVMESAEEMEYELEGHPIRVYRWGKGPSIFLAHGWNSRAATMTAFVEPLLEAGFSVVSQDHIAHGESGGDQCTALKVSQGYDTLLNLVGPISGVITHSFGSIGVNILLHRGGSMGRVVHLAPFCSIIRRFYEFAYASGMSEEEVQGFIDYSDEVFGPGRLAGIDGTLIAPKFTAPALIVHDEGDLEIPQAEGELLARSWPGAEFLPTKGLGHYRVVRDKTVIQRAVSFVTG